MPWNGSGVFARLFSWVADRDGGIDILADRMDQDTDDIAQGMMHCLTVNGETVPVANLPMANFRHTGASVGVADTDYATLGQIKNGGGGLAGGLLPAAGGTITGDLAVTGNTTLGGTLAVSGVASLAGLTATTAAFAGTLSATGAFSGVAGSFSATLTVGGATTLHALTATGLILNGNGTVNGDLTLSGAGADLTVGGSSALHAVTATTGNFSSTLTVAGTANLAGVNTTGALSVGGTLTAGTANFSNDVTISGGGSTLTVGGGGLVVNGSAATRALACTTFTNSDRMTPMAGILPGTGGPRMRRRRRPLGQRHRRGDRPNLRRRDQNRYRIPAGRAAAGRRDRAAALPLPRADGARPGRRPLGVCRARGGCGDDRRGP